MLFRRNWLLRQQRQTLIAPYQPHGFTMIELVTVMILVGVLAVAALPRLSNKQNFDTRGFFDKTKAAVQFARKAAIAERRTVCVAITGNAYTITQSTTFNGACSAPLLDSSTGNAFSAISASGVTLTATVSPINFDAQGSTLTASTVTVGGTLSFLVEANTGYVH